MSKNSKGYRKVATRKAVTAAHKQGNKLQNPKPKHEKAEHKRWFMGGITQAGRVALGIKW
jgi:hypothetical protein